MFTEKELAESIEELAALEAEIQKLDKLYDDIHKQLPDGIADLKLNAEDSSVVDELMAEAKRKAENEGRARAANYRDSHTVLEEPNETHKTGRRGLIV